MADAQLDKEAAAVKGSQMTSEEAQARFTGESRVGLKDWRLSPRAQAAYARHPAESGVTPRNMNYYHEDDGK